MGTHSLNVAERAGTESHRWSAAALPAAYVEPRWYAAYSCAKHEKRIAYQLQQKSVEYFLPLYEAVHKWKDRRKRVELPLFPGYIFVRIPLKDRLQVLEIPSVVRLVGFNGHPTPLPDSEIELLRSGLAHQLRAQPHPFLTKGRRVRIQRGPLAGLEGILTRRKGCLRVVLSVDLIMRSIAVDIDTADILPI
jgi:transcription antitermination factor NusG